VEWPWKRAEQPVLRQPWKRLVKRSSLTVKAHSTLKEAQTCLELVAHQLDQFARTALGR
jgi:hypothetical protein